MDAVQGRGRRASESEGEEMNQDRYARGYKSAKKHLSRGEDATALRAQASSDLEPDDFTRGWKAACDEKIANYPNAPTQIQSLPAR